MGKSIILTSNQSLTGWGDVFGDPIIATAILDRLLHHSTMLNVKGDDAGPEDESRSLLQLILAHPDAAHG